MIADFLRCSGENRRRQFGTEQQLAMASVMRCRLRREVTLKLTPTLLPIALRAAWP
jgi:hypothetical protein